jgi:hypothetical protein
VPQSKRHPARRPQARSPKRPHPSTRPTSKTKATAPPARSAFRRRLEMLSAPVLIRMNVMPKWFVPLVLAAFLIGGLVIPSRLSGLLLLVVAAFLGWLVAISWPLVKPRGRLLRVAVVALVVVVAVFRFTANF